MGGIYIHIPFCKKKCIYCDFYSVAKSGYADRYAVAIGDELRMRSKEIDLSQVTTIYIGGGTPSQMSFEQLQVLVDGIKRYVDFENIEEFTIEVNPDDVTVDYIKSASTLGVNRVSMGVQSFVDEELQMINRRHSSQQAIDAVQAIRDAGITNISLDLIYGLPGQTIDTWCYSVGTLLSLDIEHISAYNLSYEEGTLLTKKRDRGEIEEVDDDTCVKMYEILVEKLQRAGYERYEISNFSKPNRHSRHNSSYWAGTPYLGLGAAAHSFDGESRRYNPSSVKHYLEGIENEKVVYEVETEEWWQRYNELVMVGLRTMWGVDMALVEEKFGKKILAQFEAAAEPYLKQGLMGVKGTKYYVTSKGIMLSDSIIRDIMYVE